MSNVIDITATKRAKTAAVSGPASVVAFPVSGVGKRLFDPNHEADRIIACHPPATATDAERAKAFRKARANWNLHVEIIRTDLGERGLPASTIQQVIAQHTDEVRTILARRKAARSVSADGGQS